MSLQRDYIGVIPIACAFLCIPNRSMKPTGLIRFAIAGLLFGTSTLIKPHLCLGLPIVFGTLLAFRWENRARSWRDFFRCSAVCGLSFLLPVLLAVIWLVANSALADFMEIFVDYLPLHSALTRWHENITGWHRVFYLIENTLRFRGYRVLVVCALFACYHTVGAAVGQKREIVLSYTAVFLGTLAYSVYPTLAGKFWDYHFMPSVYFFSIASSLCIYIDTRPPGKKRAVSLLRASLAVVIVFLTICMQVNLPRFCLETMLALHPNYVAPPPKEGRVDEISRWLSSRVGPSDTVQPLDWENGGAIHAMLLSRVELATEFMYDYHFYHHISSPFTQNLRQVFLEQLRQAAPRFVIEIQQYKPRITGIDSSRSFPELTGYLRTHYSIVTEGDGYIIHERISDPSQEIQRQQINTLRS